MKILIPGFPLQQFPGRNFRLIQNSGRNVQEALEWRALVVQVEGGDGRWLDFSTVREDDIASLPADVQALLGR